MANEFEIRYDSIDALLSDMANIFANGGFTPRQAEMLTRVYTSLVLIMFNEFERKGGDHD